MTHGGVRAVDDGRQGEHGAARVEHDRVHERVPDDGHELAQLQVVLRVVLRGAPESMVLDTYLGRPTGLHVV